MCRFLRRTIISRSQLISDFDHTSFRSLFRQYPYFSWPVIWQFSHDYSTTYAINPYWKNSQRGVLSIVDMSIQWHSDLHTTDRATSSKQYEGQSSIPLALLKKIQKLWSFTDSSLSALSSDCTVGLSLSALMPCVYPSLFSPHSMHYCANQANYQPRNWHVILHSNCRGRSWCPVLKPWYPYLESSLNVLIANWRRQVLADWAAWGEQRASLACSDSKAVKECIFKPFPSYILLVFFASVFHLSTIPHHQCWWKQAMFWCKAGD